jgi:uncharacterized protein YggE
MSLKLLLLTLAALPFLVHAQDARPAMRRQVVRATGEATLTAKPDQARLSIGVITDAATAEEAMQHNATQTTTVLDTLKKIVTSNGEIKTSNYSVSPQYKYEQGHSPEITGYQASNTVEVTLSDLSLIGKVIDGVGHAGANNINSIAFTLKNDQAVRAKVIAEATKQARANAEAIAQALNVRVVGVASAETVDGGSPRPMQPMFSMMGRQAMAAPTPVETGTLDVHATVSVTLEVEK